ncbi:ATPase, T2SS/T4P/T4SS family [Solibacillus sp. FSL W7-1324]|uniref:ATPase, T2SS/T4P/T4SS family n=1 Tax=Solibacillus sp. FSL W7-1324 TaxID=2921701 RepID=UPI0030F9B78F
MIQTSSLNLLLIIAIGLFALAFIFLKLTQARKETEIANKKKSYIPQQELTVEELKNYVSKKMIDITTKSLYLDNVTEEEFKRSQSRRKELKNALKNCNTGDLSAKTYVREYIYDLLVKDKKINEELVGLVIPFDNSAEMTAREKFETMLYVNEKKHGYKALSAIIARYKWDVKNETGSYIVTEDHIHNAYKQEMKNQKLSYQDKMRIVSQVVYSHYKGFGLIDEIRDMQIDGVSAGVSGYKSQTTVNEISDDDFLSMAKSKETTFSNLRSIWVMNKGKTIHFAFLEFDSESELRRIVTNAYKYGYPGQLSETNPAIINEMADGSRVTAARPKLTESWAVFIRKKYEAKKLGLPDLFKQDNSQIAIELLRLLMRSKRTVAVTGAQGSGKTTLLMALIEHIHTELKLRIQETKFELNLRNLYPGRNILSFQETETYSGQDGLDLQKKTDGDVTVLGEVATDPVAAWMIQTSQVASEFTLFTHHAKTFKDLVFALRNSLLKTGMFSNERVAEQQVISVLEFDVHMVQIHATGERIIERITECVPIDQTDEHLKILDRLDGSKEKDVRALISLATTFFQQQTQTQQFKENTILEYRDGAYVAVNPISEERMKRMMLHLSKEDAEDFKELMSKSWGLAL